MKQLLIGLFLLLSYTLKAQVISCPLPSAGNNAQYVDTLGALKTRIGNHRCFAYAYGIDSLRDGRGGVYMYDTALTNAHDGFLYIQPGFGSACPQAKGRWARANQSVLQYPQGKLFKIAGGYKVFIGSGTMSGSSNDVTLNLTTDNTAGGPNIFSGANLMAFANIDMTTIPLANNAQPAGVTYASNKKTVTFRFSYTAAATVLGISVLSLPGSIPAGTPYRYIVHGD